MTPTSHRTEGEDDKQSLKAFLKKTEAPLRPKTRFLTLVTKCTHCRWTSSLLRDDQKNANSGWKTLPLYHPRFRSEGPANQTDKRQMKRRKDMQIVFDGHSFRKT